MTVVGLGIEGIDLVRFLAGRGARVTVSDVRPAEALRNALVTIADSEATLSLGANRAEDCATADYVFVSQGVPQQLPALAAARAAGVPVSSAAQLFLELCPAPVAAVTGSSGKSTTAALVGAMLEAAGADYVLGGNIGVGLLGLLERIGPRTRVMLELSHTQLETVSRSPQLACVTNVTPNHLDRYTWEAYVALKRRVFAFQQADDTVIFNADDTVAAAFAREAPGHVTYTARQQALPGDGVTLSGDVVVRREHGREHPVLPRAEIRLRGDHNVDNVLSAVAIASRLGVDDRALASAVRAFAGIPHRLEPVAAVSGVQYVNDSIATTPERTLAGMRAFAEPLVLLLGGRHKELPLAVLATEAAARCRAVVAFGEAGELFAAAVREAVTAAGCGATVEQVADVEGAVAAAARLARAGDVVLFAPAGTSFDAYANFEQRGAAFRTAVARLGSAT